VTEELDDLLRRLSDGPLPPEDVARLNELLHGNPEACERYLHHAALDAHLRYELGARPPLPNVVPTPRPRRTPRPLLRFAAGLTLLASSMWRSERSTAGSVATLLFADDCQWDEPMVEGQRLSAGPLRLRRGLAVLRFDGGAAVVLEAPSELRIVSRVFAWLDSGRLTVRAPKEAAGFTVRAPASDVVDLGTEFAVVVERGGATEVHVLEGEVSYAKAGAPQDTAELLSHGKAVRFDGAQAPAPRAVPLNAPRFSDLLSRARLGPREDLLLAHESFDYPVGRLPLERAAGGKGWVGTWGVSPGVKFPPGVNGDLSIASAKLQVAWPIQGGRGPMLEGGADYQSRRRVLARPVRLDEDGVYFVSVLSRWEAPSTAGQRLPSVRMVLRSSADFDGDHVMFNLPIHGQPQLDLRAGAIFTSERSVALGRTQLWVGKIVARKQGEDEIFFRIYGEGEPLDPMEPGTWSVRSRDIRSDAKLDLLLLTKLEGGTCWWDEVRVGKSWRAVVPTEAFR
jgi:hypothetical protein